MRRPPPRVIDPRNVGRMVRSSRLGAISERELQNEQDRIARSDHEPPVILSASLGPWYRENIPASGGVTTMRLLHLATSSTNPASRNLMYNTGTSAGFVMANAGRVVGAAIQSSSAVTAGKMIAAARINDTGYQLIADCELNTTYTVSRMAWLGWRRGFQFPAGGEVEAVVYGSSTLAPTTADVQVTLFVAWEER